MTFRGDENLKKTSILQMQNVYRYSKLIKLINIIEQTAVLL